jgi:hypothetical protein
MQRFLGYLERSKRGQKSSVAVYILEGLKEHSLVRDGLVKVWDALLELSTPHLHFAELVIRQARQHRFDDFRLL